MRDLAPHIYRQRLLIEGIYARDVGPEDIRAYFDLLLERLALRSHAEPIITSSEGTGKPVNQGFEAFLPLIDSGVALYTWNSSRFLSVVVFTCKEFSAETAVALTTEFFALDPVEFTEF